MAASKIQLAQNSGVQRDFSEVIELALQEYAVTHHPDLLFAANEEAKAYGLQHPNVVLHSSLLQPKKKGKPKNAARK